MNIQYLLENITLKDLIGYIVIIVGIISAIIEWNTKLPWHPLTAIFSYIGRQFNKSIMEDLQELKKQTEENAKAIGKLDDKVELKFQEKAKDDDEKEAKRLRASIISFSDSCRVKTLHTRQHFENVFRDIDDYNRYCEIHNIPNHFIEAEIKYIKDIYDECIKENKFL